MVDKLRDKCCAVEGGDQRGRFPSAVPFIAWPTPTFCGYSAPSQRRSDAEPHIPSGGSVAEGSVGSPKAPGMWHRAPGCVRAGSCPPSHKPPLTLTWSPHVSCDFWVGKNSRRRDCSGRRVVTSAGGAPLHHMGLCKSLGSSEGR